MGIVKNMGGYIPGGNFPVGSLMGRNFLGGSFPDTITTVLEEKKVLKNEIEKLG